MITRPWVRSLAEPGGEVAELGGKGASLARLAAAGFPVPEGFCVTTGAFKAALDDRRCAPEATDGDEELAGWILEHPIRPDLARAILDAYTELGAPAVAVRSSATAEDSSAASFAGQLESVLNVTGAEQLLAAVQHCWASLWSARAAAYRQHQGIAVHGLGVAVVVQRLISADAAGIMFTADPMTGASDTVTINASWGLGDAVVAGEVTPDVFRVDAATATLVDQTIADKPLQTVPGPRGTSLGPVPQRLRQRPSLTRRQAERLARTGLDIADLYQTPVDVEWCRAGDQLFIVQARPITTGAPPTRPDPWNDSRTTDALWTSTNVGEAIPDVLTPASWSMVQQFLSVAMATSAIPPHVGYGRIGGRLYLNLSVLYGLARAVGVSKRRVRALTEDVFGRVPDEVPVPRIRASRLSILAATLPVAATVVRHTRQDATRLDTYLSTHPDACRRLRETIGWVDDPTELARLWHSAIKPGLDEASWMLSAATRSSGPSLVTTRRRLRALVGEADTNAILTGLGGPGGELASLDLMRGLDELADGSIDREEFNQTYGHRGPHEFEISTPRPGEDPAWIDSQLAQRTASPLGYRALLEAQANARTAAWTRLREQHPRRADRLARTTARWSQVARNRESARSEVVRSFWVVRAYVQRAGDLTGLGDDVYFLDADQIVAALDGAPPDRAAIALARQAYDAYRALPIYPPLILGPFDPYAWPAIPTAAAISQPTDSTSPTTTSSEASPGQPAGWRASSGSSRTPRTAPSYTPARCSSPPSPTWAGRRCSRVPLPSSPMSAPHCPTRRSWRGNSGSPRSSAAATPPPCCTPGTGYASTAPPAW